MNILESILYFFKSKPKPVAPGKMRCLFVTDIFSDKRSRMKDFKKIAAAGYNAVYGLIDLQIGQPSRPHVTKGRTQTKLTSTGIDRINECLYHGLTPVIGIRNDWAVRNRRGEVIPSLGVAANQVSVARFYGIDLVAQEERFLDDLVERFGKHIAIQLAIEAMDRAAVNCYRQLADHLLGIGFKGPVYINLLSDAQAAWRDYAGVITAHTYPGVMKGKTSPHAIFNTDGDPDIRPDNANEARKRLMNTGKGWILWADANIRGSIHPDFLRRFT